MELYLQLKECQFKLKKFKSVEKTISSLIRFRADLPELITQWGLIKMNQKLYEEARILFFKAVEGNPHSVIAQLSLGKACLKLQQFDDASEALSNANMLDPTNMEVWIHLIYCSMQDRTKHVALQYCLREALKLQIENPKLVLKVILNKKGGTILA